jgi:octaprenyl-diphosphate synthase
VGVVISLEDKGKEPGLANLSGLAAPDLERVNQVILSRTGSDVAMIPEVANHLISSGGKRLRPMLTLAMAGLCGYRGEGHVKLAASVEFMHTATLLHDDVVDQSDMRRGKAAARMLWGNEASVLVGDFLYSRAFQMMVDIGNLRILQILADATNTIAEGEVMQLVNCHDPETTERRYLDTIRFKTAKLFEAAAQLGAVLAGSTPEIEIALASYGRHLGTAFQLVDELKAAGAGINTLRLGEDMVAKTVCRHAVKANDPLAGKELEHLVEDLRRCEMPYTCPHGRPTLIEMSWRELEKKFGRTG